MRIKSNPWEGIEDLQPTPHDLFFFYFSALCGIYIMIRNETKIIAKFLGQSSSKKDKILISFILVWFYKFFILITLITGVFHYLGSICQFKELIVENLKSIKVEILMTKESKHT